MTAKSRLLSALAAIEAHNIEKYPNHHVINVDLSLLHEHDAEVKAKAYDHGWHEGVRQAAEVRKPLVDLLEQAYHKLLISNYKTLAKSIAGALAKVKAQTRRGEEEK